MTILNRRAFLLLGGSSFLLSQCQRNNVVGIEASRNSQQVYRSQNGELNVDLEASHRLVQIGNQTLNLMTYNGQLPGPRLEAYPGDQVRVQFRNLLSEATNLHFHGLHIPPTDQADNVFRKVAPGETVHYNFAIPNPHPGTFAYYHPHLHGSVANQILGGLGGIFIIRNELDTIPEIQASQEIFLFLKDFAGQTDRWMTGLMAGREGEVITVNGRLQPNFSIAKGEIVRLRLVNGSNAKFYRLALAEHSLFVIATDGYSLPQPTEQEEVLLSPGERVDILVQGQYDSGDYSLLNRPYDRGRMGMMGSSRTTESQTIATLTYQGTQESQSLPTQLVPRQTFASATIERNFEINHGMVPGQGMQFLINGQSFNPRRVDTRVTLDTVEDWVIKNVGVMDHPFHIHTNAFQVIEKNGIVETIPQWKDTVLIPTGESIKIRIPFQDFVGRTVYHCHILDHEEMGMMGIIEMNLPQI